ncbi:MAG: hypothetical protein KDB90_17320 [Planctomycetes bacterium]|nr:hypothetical protein [Planctomycetota bacterium]
MQIPRQPTKRAPPARVRMVSQVHGGPGAQATAVPIAATSSHDELVALKRSLEAISLSLNRIDLQALSDTERDTWAKELDRVDLAIARVRVSLLEGIVAEFEAELPALQSAIAQLEAQLASLQQAVDVINAVAGVLGVVEQIVGLAG